MTKINVWRIVQDHFSTFRNFDTDTVSVIDYFLFLGIPVGATGLCWKIGFNFGPDVLNALLAAFSIFAGLLLNLLVLICGFAGQERFSGYDASSTTRRRFLREIHQNLSYAILVSIAVVVVALIGLSAIKYTDPAGAKIQNPHPVLTGALVFFISNFVLTLLMVLKRMHYLLLQEFSGPRSSKPKVDRAA